MTVTMVRHAGDAAGVPQEAAVPAAREEVAGAREAHAVEGDDEGIETLMISVGGEHFEGIVILHQYEQQYIIG